MGTIALKVGIVIGVLYLLYKTTDVGAAVVATAVGCPAGTVPGPWLVCGPAISTCDPGTHQATTSWGATYCAKDSGGSVTYDPGTT